MSLRHKLDPEAQHRAAAMAGALAAQGLIDPASILNQIVTAARRAAPQADPSGLRMRLHHTLADSQAATARTRAATARAIAATLAPLLDRRAPGPALLAAADAADPQGVLTRLERIAIAEQEILRRLRPAARR